MRWDTDLISQAGTTAYATAVDHVNDAYPGCFRYVARLGLRGSYIPAESAAQAER
ncbi:hypothetical protein ABT352_22830 [Streptosporangium sp. NPDC000563]|uniref:hypothetical protein n=1 Tax=Streptosporangium sp. NPDC000563 TaxID=3154366 RepID=UPI003330C674